MKKINIFSTIAFFVLCTFIGSCNGKGSKDNNSDTITDSIQSAQTLIEKQLQRLSDTIFESAKTGVNFSVTVADTTVSGNLDNLNDMYADTPGAFTFRKGSRRDADFGGYIKSKPTKFTIDWTFKTEEPYRETSLGTWGGGTGWTGEPVYVEWPDTLLEKMKSNGAVYSDFSGKEIIFGSLCGKVYFLDYLSGKPSRKALPGVNPIKGSVSLDPSLNGNLYVGQGVPAERPFGAFLVDLFTNKVDFYRPEDPKAQRRWGAFDSSSVRVAQFLMVPGENGSIYKYIVAPGKLTLHSVLRYKVNGAAPGIESSMAVYSNYGFTCDNHGNILGINLDTMEPVWLYRLGDDIDSTPVVAEEDGIPYLYVGCEIDRQGTSGTANFVKLNATNGEEVWKLSLPGNRYDVNNKHFDGGYFSTSLLGTGNCKDLIFAQCVRNTKGQNGEFIAIDRKSGDIKYQIPLKHYGWSSPVGFLDENGSLYIVTADCAGNIYIIDGLTGEIIYVERVGSNFESSAVVNGNSLVIGSRGSSIFKITLE